MEQLAQAIASSKSTAYQQELKNLKHREKQRNEARRIKRLCNKSRGGKVVKIIEVLHPGTDQEVRIECTTKEDMEGAAQRENEHRFSKALTTP